MTLSIVGHLYTVAKHVGQLGGRSSNHTPWWVRKCIVLYRNKVVVSCAKHLLLKLMPWYTTHSLMWAHKGRGLGTWPTHTTASLIFQLSANSSSLEEMHT